MPPIPAEQIPLPLAAPASGILIPDVRRDCSFRLAALYREIVLLDHPEDGCYAGNASLARTLNVHPSTVRSLVAILKACGLVTVEVAHGRERSIRPRAQLVDLFGLWPELARACAGTKRLLGSVRRAAITALRSVGALVRRFAQPPAQDGKYSPLASDSARKYSPQAGSASGENAARNRPESGSANAPKTASQNNKYSPSTHGSTRLFPYYRRSGAEGQQQTAVRPAVVDADPVVVSLLRGEAGLSEPLALSIAVEAGKKSDPLKAAKTAIAVLKANRSVPNVGGFLRSAIRGAWQPPAPKATHPSEIPKGVEAPRRVFAVPQKPIDPVEVAAAKANMAARCASFARFEARRAGQTIEGEAK